MGIRPVLRRCFWGSGWKRRMCCGICVVLVLAVLCSGVIQILYTVKLCSDELSKLFLMRLCRTYKQGSVNGSLCPDLCSNHRMTFVNCLNYREGKIIIILDWNGTPIVLKTKEMDIPYTKTLPFVLGLSEGDFINTHYKHKYPSWDEFRRNVLQELKLSIGFTTEGERMKNILTELWTINPEKYIPVNQNPELAKIAAMDSIWSLVQQTEFTFMKLNQDWKYIPKIYGTCGQFYAMEFMDTDTLTEGHIFSTQQHPWRQKADIAVQILELVHDADIRKPQSLHMCDIKQENFGVSAEGLFKAIDVDMFFDDVRMNEEIMSVKKCSSQDDCDFFDCKGFCVKETKRCFQKRVNNNLQTVCEKLFLSVMQNAYNGLLRNPPSAIKDELNRALSECAHPPNSPSREVPGKADHILMETLLRLLKTN